MLYEVITDDLFELLPIPGFQYGSSSAQVCAVADIQVDGRIIPECSTGAVVLDNVELITAPHEVMAFAGQELQSWSARLFGESGLVMFDPIQFAGNDHSYYIVGYRQRNRDFDLSVSYNFV